MEENVICPYCGMEMEILHDGCVGGWVAMYWCCKCGSEGPVVTQRQRESKEKFEARCKTSALHRYSPPSVPLTLEEVFTLSREEGSILYLEYLDGEARRRGYNGYYEPSLTFVYSPIYGNKPQIDFYAPGVESPKSPDPAVYGIGWRCWERRPTKKEALAKEG